MKPLEIVGRTPKNNCGECGFPTCLAFGAAVCATGVELHKCPYLEAEGLVVARMGLKLEDVARGRELALVEHLQGKIVGADFRQLAPKIGATCSEGLPEVMTFLYLGQRVELSRKGILLGGGEPEDPRDQILLYNYAYSGGGRKPAGAWIGMESMANSIAKVKTLFTYCEAPLTRLFSGRVARELADGIARAGGEGIDDETADLAFQFQVLPMIPQRLLFWAEEVEEGFEAKVKILYDLHALDYLDIESLLFSSERLAERLALLLAD